MKKCSFCDSELRPFGGGEPTCWLCNGDAFEEETEEALRQRKEQERKKGVCCPNPECPPQVRPHSERHCVNCGESLKEATLELWLEKCVKPGLKEGISEMASLIEMARLMGCSAERAETRLNHYLAQNSKQSSEAQATEDAKKERSAKAKDSLEGSASDFERVDPPLDTISGTGAESLRAQLNHSVFERPLRIVLICVLLSIPVVFYLGLKISSTTLPPSPTPTPTPALGTQPVAPPGMTYIPGGEFLMGRDQVEGGDKYESPAHLVRVEPIFIDTYEVTREEYRKCVEARKCPLPQGWTNGTYPPDTGRWPVTGVAWEAADAYARWVEKRLPTEEEWEFAARGSDGRRYPWGNEWQEGLANADGARNDPANVGEYRGKSPFGVFDMVGNAWEWTSGTIYSYPNGSINEDKLPETTRKKMKVIRGGCYLSDRKVATVTYRRGWLPPQGSNYEQTGFRCAKKVPE